VQLSEMNAGDGEHHHGFYFGRVLRRRRPSSGGGPQRAGYGFTALRRRALELVRTLPRPGHQTCRRSREVLQGGTRSPGGRTHADACGDGRVIRLRQPSVRAGGVSKSDGRRWKEARLAKLDREGAPSALDGYLDRRFGGMDEDMYGRRRVRRDDARRVPGTRPRRPTANRSRSGSNWSADPGRRVRRPLPDRWPSRGAPRGAASDEHCGSATR